MWMLLQVLLASCCSIAGGATHGGESPKQLKTWMPKSTIATRAHTLDTLTHLVLVQLRGERVARRPASSRLVALNEPHGWLQERKRGRNATIIAHIPKTAVSSFINDIPAYLPYGYGLQAQEMCVGALKNMYYQRGDRIMVMLRDPVAHVYSQYSMCCCSSWGKEVTRRYRDSHGDFVGLSGWLNHFGTNTTEDHFGCYNPQDMQTRYVSCDNGDAHAYQVPNTQKALDRLRAPWIFVGVAEYYQESICVYLARLNHRLPAWCDCSHPNLWNSFSSMNKTWGVPSHNIGDLSEREKKRIATLTVEDTKLYSAGLVLFMDSVHKTEHEYNVKILCDDSRVRKSSGMVGTVQQAAQHYVSSDCSCAKGEAILDIDSCKRAAASFGLSFKPDDVSWPRHVKGCARRPDGFYFNTHPTGACSDFADAVCSNK